MELLGQQHRPLPAGVEIWATNSYSALAAKREELCHQALLFSPMPSGNKPDRTSSVSQRSSTCWRQSSHHLPMDERAPSPSKSPSGRTLSSGWSPTSPSGWKTRWQRGELLSSSLSGAHKLWGSGGKFGFLPQTCLKQSHASAFRTTPNDFSASRESFSVASSPAWTVLQSVSGD